ncbi:aldehyde dehydrogenase family protein [Sphingosinicella soli]|uniref:Acyl-CoA reductase-like NAD-dependent aldehyde dehydrogenase n=1 Tax=Sphingosinicella soli TaxID=333708 RepID=A0A7W7B4I6_9SPHN|nr:aldehyde dehydrogenase family protein [Sphingosinicella soli]MBB4632955.1 acyl-CoA reductase-like NAD-dependent aldehyde dehydrogenase [Sphingosinicella soli]
MPTATTFPVIDPATAAPFIDAPLARLADVDAAVAAARRAFPGWASTPIEERARAVLAVADAIEAAKDELAALLSREQGKPLVSAGGEIMGALGWARATAALRLPVDVIKNDDSVRIEVHRKPLGVVGSISPWNFPVMIAIWHIIPALVAGNTVVMKPSSYTPLAALRMVEIANAHLPPGVLNSLTGEGDIGRAIAGHSGIDKIVFTGSTPTGRSIMASGAANLKRLTLELGGNDAAIVLPDADIDKIAPKLFLKAFMNSGQICAAVKRIYVHESVHDALAEKLAEMARAASVGPASDPGNQFGPVQNRMQFDHVCALADEAKAKGGRFLAGGEPMGREGYFFPLSVAVDVSDGMRIVDEEQFGPVLPIIRYSNVEDALARANASENGLGGSVWSADVEGAIALAQRLECGTAWVNDHASISPDVPFGGAKQSGVGVEFGLYGLEEYTQLQTVRIAKV